MFDLHHMVATFLNTKLGMGLAAMFGILFLGTCLYIINTTFYTLKAGVRFWPFMVAIILNGLFYFRAFFKGLPTYYNPYLIALLLLGLILVLHHLRLAQRLTLFMGCIISATTLYVYSPQQSFYTTLLYILNSVGIGYTLIVMFLDSKFYRYLKGKYGSPSFSSLSMNSEDSQKPQQLDHPSIHSPRD